MSGDDGQVVSESLAGAAQLGGDTLGLGGRPAACRDRGRLMGVTDRPRVVCLCGSLHFADLFAKERRRLTGLGMIVLGPEDVDGELTAEASAALGELHLRRIDLADEVRVVSESGYLGEATRREIAYARRRGAVVTTTDPDLHL